jgi:hypothetical protein
VDRVRGDGPLRLDPRRVGGPITLFDVPGLMGCSGVTGGVIVGT